MRRSTGIRMPGRKWRCATGGREAVTHWEMQEAFNGRDGKPVAALLACQLETGRTHQIRVHLAHIGHPLMGDAVYGPHFKTKASHLGAREPGGPGRPRPPSAACIPPGAGAPQNRGDSGVDVGFAGGSDRSCRESLRAAL